MPKHISDADATPDTAGLDALGRAGQGPGIQPQDIVTEKVAA